MTITIFGHQMPSIDLDAEESKNVMQKTEQKPECQIESSRTKSVDPIRPKMEICEGWAPPPTPLHGPCFRSLPEPMKQTLVKLHKNLGHPNPNQLSEHLKAQGASQRVIDAASDFVCDACVESNKASHQRPGRLHDPIDFNHTVGIDGIFWKGKSGFEVYVIHAVDECSTFQIARRTTNRNADMAIGTFRDMWISWAGPPTKMYFDPAGEFISHTWSQFLQEYGIETFLTSEAWQRGRVERHGDILKSMLTRVDNENPIADVGEFDHVLSMCCQAKNQLARHKGFSPEQIVLGKSTRVPASLTSDEEAASHSALGDEPESERFRLHLERGSAARKAFLFSDNDQSIRRALLRRSCPVRGPYLPGQLVMYWTKNPRNSRHGAGRWHGPAKVIQQEGQSTVWLSHLNKIIRAPPENIRPSSLRDWNSQSKEIRDDADLFPPHSQPSARVPEPDMPVMLDDPTAVLRDTGASSGYSPSIAMSQPERENTPITIESSTPSENPNPESPVHEPDTLNHPEPPTETEEMEAETPSFDDDVDSSLFADCQTVHQDVLQFDTFVAEVEHTSKSNPTEYPILLMEDQMPYVHAPLEPKDEQAFCLEIPVTAKILEDWSQESDITHMACVAAAGKRARAEVSLKTLSHEEKKLFDIAKDKEISCWLQTNAIRPILREKMNPDQILRSRWILTWKKDDQGGRKAKARLVVLGYLDPKLTEVARDSPTLSKEGRATILQCVASSQFELISFDITTAFLRGKADAENPLAMEPPSEFRQKLGMNSHQVCELLGNAYGRVDAPLLFYKELRKHLTDLGFQSHPLDPCIYMLKTTDKEGHETLHGILGMHVDDGIGGGDKTFRNAIDRLQQKLPFGSFKTRQFKFTGIDCEQLPDFSIRCSQEEYVMHIPSFDIPKHRRSQPQEGITNEELSKLRGIIGSLQYAVTHTRPDIAAKLGEVQCQMSHPTIETMLMANRVLREAQEYRDVKIYFSSIPKEELTHISFGDASFAGPSNLASFQGTLICATNRNLNRNKPAPMTPLNWTSKKISRVVRSTLSAEAYSMSKSVDKLGWLRLMWGCAMISNFNWREPAAGFKQLPQAVICTDCKSLFDLVSRRAMPACEEYRTTLEVLLLKERCSEHCHFRWVPTTLMLADALTKAMDSTLLRTFLASGQFQIYDEESVLRYNAHRKQAISWIQGQQTSPHELKSTS